MLLQSTLTLSLRAKLASMAPSTTSRWYPKAAAGRAVGAGRGGSGLVLALQQQFASAKRCSGGLLVFGAPRRSCQAAVACGQRSVVTWWFPPSLTCSKG